MLQKNNSYKILRIFFEDPLPQGAAFQLREISRKVNIAPLSVKRHLDGLEKEKLIIRDKHRIHNYPVYSANRNNENFRFLKKLDNVMILKESGLLDYLSDNCMPDVIILFGSAAHGEDIKGSDIDLFLLGKDVDLELKKYESRLKRKVSLFFSNDFNKLSDELKNNIINGITLKGYLKVF